MLALRSFVVLALLARALGTAHAEEESAPRPMAGDEKKVFAGCIRNVNEDGSLLLECPDMYFWAFLGEGESEAFRTASPRSGGAFTGTRGAPRKWTFNRGPSTGARHFTSISDKMAKDMLGTFMLAMKSYRVSLESSLDVEIAGEVAKARRFTMTPKDKSGFMREARGYLVIQNTDEKNKLVAGCFGFDSARCLRAIELMYVGKASYFDSVPVDGAGRKKSAAFAGCTVDTDGNMFTCSDGAMLLYMEPRFDIQGRTATSLVDFFLLRDLGQLWKVKKQESRSTVGGREFDTVSLELEGKDAPEKRATGLAAGRIKRVGADLFMCIAGPSEKDVCSERLGDFARHGPPLVPVAAE